LPVDLPEQPKPEDIEEKQDFVIAAPILGWLIDVGSSIVIIQLIQNIEAGPVVQLIAALFLTFVGGYSAAFIAGYRELEHSFVMGLLSFGTIIVLAARFPRTALPDWYDPIAFTLTIPMAVLGGWLRIKLRPRRNT
jgi:hypothetical protein